MVIAIPATAAVEWNEKEVSLFKLLKRILAGSLVVAKQDVTQGATEPV